MADEIATDTRLQDALKPETRSARKSLLISSFLGVAVVKVGVLPSKISALGIEFDKLNQKSFACLLAVLVVYFLATFFIYAVSDFLLWLQNKRKVELNFTLANIFPSMYAIAGVYKLSMLSSFVAWLRCLIDFVFPVIVGIYAIYSLSTLVTTI